MANKYINRNIEKSLMKLAKEYSCILLTGPRQVGKSTLLSHICKKNTTVLTLDDVNLRKLAKEDPELFLSSYDFPIIVDEVQYAPELFSYIKIKIDNGLKPGSIFLTGSQSFELMKLSQETLAGRIAIINLSNLSQNEICNINNKEFDIEINLLKKRKGKKCSVKDIYKRIFDGGMPALISGKYTNRDIYYNSYVKTFVERDVSYEIKGIDLFNYTDFIRACACRVSQVINIHSIAMDVGISDDTAKRWLNVLEKAEIIYFLHPFSNNLLKRTIKSPKLYFFDTGLVAFLTKHSTPEILMNDSINGAILENFVINEIRKSFYNNCKEPNMYYYRDIDEKEIDLCLIADGKIHPIEIKKTSNPNQTMVSNFKLLDKSSIKRGLGAIICIKDNIMPIDKDNLIIPIWLI